MMMPGAMAHTMFHLIVPRCWCARTLETDVNRMDVIDVAMAACTTNSGGMPCQANSIVRKGTSSIPPPMPSRPAAKPTTAPSTSRQINIETSTTVSSRFEFLGS
ncbi:hypothetical protein D3C72_2112350 [compost metagenome]